MTLTSGAIPRTSPVPVQSDAPRRLSWSRLILGLSVVTTAVAGSLAVHAAWTYRPLSPGSLGGTSVWLRTGSQAPSKPTTSHGTAPAAWLIPSTAFSAGIIVDVVNHGRFDVTIDRVGFPTWGGTSHYVSQLESSKAPSWTGGTPFHPFQLKSGHHQVVVLRFEMACVNIGADSQVALQTVPVEYGFMGIHHTSTISLAEPLVLGGPSNCPGR